MFVPTLALGLAVLAVALWLQWNEFSRSESDDSGSEQRPHPAADQTKLDQHYYSRRDRSRRQIHVLIGLCGLLILVAAFAGPGTIYFAAWLIVVIALGMVVTLAGLDALRTHRYYHAKLRSFSQDDHK